MSTIKGVDCISRSSLNLWLDGSGQPIFNLTLNALKKAGLVVVIKKISLTSYEVSNVIQMNIGNVYNTPRDYDDIRLH